MNLNALQAEMDNAAVAHAAMTAAKLARRPSRRIRNSEPRRRNSDDPFDHSGSPDGLLRRSSSTRGRTASSHALPPSVPSPRAGANPPSARGICDDDGRYGPSSVPPTVSSSSAEGRLRAVYDVDPRAIGRGAYGVVVRGKHRTTHRAVAIKQINKAKVGQKGVTALLGEVETLAMLSHPYIVKLEEVFHDANSMFIVMEYVPGGELGRLAKQFGGAFPESTVQRIALSLLLAIEHFHGRGIVHRDLKLANCLVSDVEYRPDPMADPDLGAARHSAVMNLTARQGGAASPLSQRILSGSFASNRTASASMRDQQQQQQQMGTSGASHHRALSASVTSQGSERSSSNDISEGVSANTPPPSLLVQPRPDPVVGVKIADFGFAVMVGEHSCLTSFCGTTHYMAPEVLSTRSAVDTLSYGKPVDMWSLGVMIYVLLVGEHPFKDGPRLVEQIVSGRFDTRPDRWGHASPFARDFISRLLVVDPQKRLTASDALSHPWIRHAMDLNDEDKRRKLWITQQIDDGYYAGLISDDGNDSLAITASFASVEAATASAEAAVMLAVRSVAGNPSFAVHRRNALLRRFRAAATAVRAAQKLLYVHQLAKLSSRFDLSEIPLLKNYGFLVSGRYEPPSHQRVIAAAPPPLFRGNAKALAQLLSMAESSHTVESLDLHGIELESLDAIQRVARIGASHPSLTHIDLSRNPIPPLASRALIRLSRVALKLRTIALHDTPLPAECLVQIQQNLSSLDATRRRADAARALSVGPTSPLFAFAAPPTSPNPTTVAAASQAPAAPLSPLSGPASTSPRRQVTSPVLAMPRSSVPLMSPPSALRLASQGPRLESPSPLLGSSTNSIPTSVTSPIGSSTGDVPSFAMARRHSRPRGNTTTSSLFGSSASPPRPTAATPAPALPPLGSPVMAVGSGGAASLGIGGALPKRR